MPVEPEVPRLLH